MATKETIFRVEPWSGGRPLTVTLVTEGERALKLACTCPAGRRTDQLCLHRQLIASGDLSDVQNREELDGRFLERVLAKSPWFPAIVELNRLGDYGGLGQRTAKIRKLRKEAAKAMSGGSASDAPPSPAAPANPGGFWHWLRSLF